MIIQGTQYNLLEEGPLPTSLLSYLLITYLSTFHTFLPPYFPTYLLPYLSTFHTFLPPYFPTYLLPTYQPSTLSYLLTFLPTYCLNYQPSTLSYLLIFYLPTYTLKFDNDVNRSQLEVIYISSNEPNKTC
jgi:hypothetical protein